MDAGSEVVGLSRQASLVGMHALFEVLRLLVAHAQVVERVGLGWALGAVIALDLDGFLKSSHSFWQLP